MFLWGFLSVMGGEPFFVVLGFSQIVPKSFPFLSQIVPKNVHECTFS